MVDESHLKIFNKGKVALINWRKKHPKTIMDLTNYTFNKIDLPNSVFEYVDFSNSIFKKSDLNDVQFSCSKFENTVFDKTTEINNTTFYNCKLKNTVFNEEEIYHLDFHNSKLNSVSINSKKLYFFELSLSDLKDMIMQNIEILSSQFIYSKLSNVKLNNIKLFVSEIRGMEFNKVSFNKSKFGGNSINFSDLNDCIGLESIKNLYPSSIGIDTIILTVNNHNNFDKSTQKKFLLNCGVPKEILILLQKEVKNIKYNSCFISYGKPDEIFAKKLVTQLKKRGVSCWLYDYDYTGGEKTWREITQKRREHDKFIVVCSKKSLIREGVLKEIEEQIDENEEKIISVSLDESWKKDDFKITRGNRDLKHYFKNHNYIDFSDESTYKTSLDKLLKCLETK